jgi:hypothetical protein
MPEDASGETPDAARGTRCAPKSIDCGRLSQLYVKEQSVNTFAHREDFSIEEEKEIVRHYP